MDCIDFVEIVTDYLDRRLDADTLGRFEAHVAQCDGCETYLDQIRATIALSGRLGATDLDPATRAAVVRLFRGWEISPG
jgi:anti-sigma factor RsiW